MTKLWVGDRDMSEESFTFTFHGAVAVGSIINIPLTHDIDVPNLGAGWASGQFHSDNMTFHRASNGTGSMAWYTITAQPSNETLGSVVVQTTGLAAMGGSAGGAVKTIEKGSALRCTVGQMTGATPLAPYLTLNDVGLTIKAYRRA